MNSAVIAAQICGVKSMKIYKNPFVSRESYFVKTGKAFSYKMEGSKSKGYAVDFIDGKWQVREVNYYDSSLRYEMPIIAENRVSISSVIERAILDAVLDLVGSAKIDGKGESVKVMANELKLYAARDTSTGKLVSDITNPKRKYWDKRGNAEKAIDYYNKSYANRNHKDWNKGKHGTIELVVFKLVEVVEDGE